MPSPSPSTIESLLVLSGEWSISPSKSQLRGTIEALRLNGTDGLIVSVLLREVGGKRFLQIAASREKPPLSRGLLMKVLARLVPSVRWTSVQGQPMHAVAFLTS